MLQQRLVFLFLPVFCFLRVCFIVAHLRTGSALEEKKK